jgi:hypothetical protein
MRRPYATFDARAYLRLNYSDPDYNGNPAFLAFLVAAYRAVGPDALVLELGGGPALCSPLAAAPHARAIDFCDLVKANLAEVRAWLEDRPEAFDWTPFIARILELESASPTSPAAVAERAALLRSKLRVVGRCDARRNPPLLDDSGLRYDVVSANFMINAVVASPDELVPCLANVCAPLAPTGTLLLTSSVDRPAYPVGRQTFPLARLQPEELVAALEQLGFPPADLDVTIVPTDEFGPTERYVFIRAGR